ncbi:GNAT family N-acetyltransferase [Clavibacter michiganensis]|uniref:Mycothiol acetyltransferase n=1 Tax=Clavibacter michiganensis TaxID=28447 RepID=A0A251YR42_9MICO|nr:GNAT family N-acetyltransferase [Clavibacter michiganensis]OUE26727.1 Mycothiol acetyltransferase [Clavibacter michiganensis]
MSAPGAVIRRVRAEDWREYRTLRLEMLEDTPLAYLETLESALTRPDSDWQGRTLRSARPGNTAYAAVDPATGRWLGAMNAYVSTDPTRVMLVSVYITPSARGRAAGVTDMLLDAVIAWARDRPNAAALRLEVHEDNPRARAYYERRGFRLTGRSVPYALDRTQKDLEMELPLD